MPKSEEKPIIILQDLDFDWTKKDIQKAIAMWNEEKTIFQISMALRSKGIKSRFDAEYETALLIMHLSREKLIELHHENEGEIENE